MHISHNRPDINENDKLAVNKVLNSEQIAKGQNIQKLEEQFIDMHQGGHACCVSSGTSAIYLLLKHLGLNKNDTISVPSYSCSALLNAVNLLGARAIPVDVKEDDFTICEKSLERLAPNSSATIAVHCFGATANIASLKKKDRLIIEDCCQSLGGPQGNEGIASIYSFYATKIITGGQGGLIWSYDKELIERIVDYREFDCRESYKPRFNFQITDIQAAMISSQFDRLDEIKRKRRNIRKKYISSIQRLFENGWRIQEGFDSENILPYRFILVAPNENERDQIKNRLYKKDIQCIIPIEKYELLHRYLNLAPEDYPNSEKLSDTCLSLPLYPALSHDEIDFLSKVLLTI